MAREGRGDRFSTGTHLLDMSDVLSTEEFEQRARRMLSRALQTRRVVVVAGTGISCGYGYPRWDAFADGVQARLEELCPPRSGVPKVSQILGSVRSPNGPRHLTDSDRTLLRLDVCEQIAELHGKSGELREEMAKLIRRRRAQPGTLAVDPLRVLIEKLEIRRFATTNYDTAIEDAIRNLADAPGSSAPVSLLPTPGRPAGLLQFALSTPGFERGVVHLHGRHDDPSSMIVSERDYRRMYHRDDGKHRAYLEALGLLFAANPIFFVGFGMAEADILRPLRHFVSGDRFRAGQELPLFALLPEADAAGNPAALQRFLYVRYGVKTIFYPARGGRREDTRTTELADALERIAADWKDWWVQWQQKPPLRRPSFNRLADDDGCVRHHPVQDSFEPRVTQRVIDALGTSGRKPVLVLGAPGTGKGTLGQAIVEAKPAAERWRRRFFATAHFSHEILSSVDAAARHFTGPRANGAAGHPLDRLAATLARPRKGQLLVLGGLERLLEPIDVAADTPAPRPAAGAQAPAARPLPTGRPITAEVARLIDVLVAGASRSAVLLTSAIRPLDPEGGPGRFSEVRLEDTTGAEPLPPRPVDEEAGAAWDELCTLLDRHGYLLAVVHAVLERKQRPGEALAWLRAATHRISAAAGPRRSGEVIRLALQAARKPAPKNVPAPLVEAVLRRVTAFTAPVPALAVHAFLLADATAAERFDARGAPVTIDAVERALERLARRKLLLRCEPSQHPASDPRYTAHTMVRQHVLRDVGGLFDAPGEPHAFDLSCYARGRGDTAPVRRSFHELVTSGIDALLDCLECGRRRARECTRPCPKGPPEAPGSRRWDEPTRHALLRATYGLLRSYWSGTVVRLHEHLDHAGEARRGVHGPASAARRVADAERRLEGSDRSRGASDLDGHPAPSDGGEPDRRANRSHYLDYQYRLLRLVDLLRPRPSRKGPALWSLPDARDHSHPRAVLYADELVWLYNEAGLAAFAQGSLRDAYDLCRLSRDASEAAEGGRGSRGSRWCQAELNIGLVQLERGRLSDARSRLESVVDRSRELRDEDLESRATGYLGLFHHLAGDFVRADELYSDAIETCRRLHNRRGLSVFCRHRADLLRTRRAFEDAQAHLDESVAAAEAGRYYDLLHFARIAEISLRSARTEPPEAALAATIRPAVVFARRVGIPKLEAEAYQIVGRIALARGDLEEAARAAYRCLEIAASQGMQLRLTVALILLGRVAAAYREVESARNLFRAAVRQAERQGYQSQLEIADRALMELERRTA